MNATEPETLNIFDRHRIPAIAAVARGGTAIGEARFTGPCAVLIGNEGGGLSKILLSAAAHRVTIPTPGNVESLNAAIAGSLLLYEASRQRAQKAPRRRPN